MAGHPSNKAFASGSHDHTIKIWDLETTKETMQLADHKYFFVYFREGVWSLQYSNDGNQLLSASPDTLIQIWDSKKGSVGARLKAHKDKVYDARFNHSNKNIVSCGIGG
jgi:WD40 repeat protein